ADVRTERSLRRPPTSQYATSQYAALRPMERSMNAAKLTGRIAASLENLASAADSAGMSSIAREIREERIPAVREGRMSMVVLGEFNHGKSSAINALLGREVLPTGITPTTSVITLIRRGDGEARAVR